MFEETYLQRLQEEKQELFLLLHNGIITDAEEARLSEILKEIRIIKNK